MPEKQKPAGPSERAVPTVPPQERSFIGDGRHDGRKVFSEDLQMFAKLSVKKSDGWTDITDEALTLKQANERGRAEAETSQQTRYEDFFETEY